MFVKYRKRIAAMVVSGSLLFASIPVPASAAGQGTVLGLDGDRLAAAITGSTVPATRSAVGRSSDTSLAAFAQGLSLPEQGGELLRRELLDALEGLTPVAAFSNGAVAAVDSSGGLLVFLAGGETYTLRLSDGERQRLELVSAEAVLHTASVERLDDAALASLRAAGRSVEVLEAAAPTETPADGLPEDMLAHVSPVNPQEILSSPAQQPPGDEGEADPVPPDEDEGGNENEGGGGEETPPSNGQEDPDDDDENPDDGAPPPAEEGEGEPDSSDEEGDPAEPEEQPIPEETSEYLAVVSESRSLSVALSGGQATVTVPAGGWAVLSVEFLLGVLDDHEFTVYFDPANGQPRWDKNVKAGQQVEQPDQTPDPPTGYSRFTGWYEESEPEEGEPYDFDTPVRSDLYLEARYTDTFTVDFRNGPGGAIIHSQEVAPGDKATAYQPTDDQLGLSGDDVFSYWYEEGEDENYAFDFAAPVHENLTLVAKLRTSHTVVFLSDGTQVDQQTVKHGQNLATTWPKDPIRAGYDFVHWSTVRDGDTPFDETTAITADLALYAVWRAKQVSYSVITWLEDPNRPNTYSFHSKANGDALAGTPVSDLSITRGTINHAYYNHTIINYDTVRGNGNTVVNLYYNLFAYTLTFNLRNYYNNNIPVGTTMKINGNTYTYGSDNHYSFKAKLGQDISKLWPSGGNAVFDTSGSSLSFYGWYNIGDNITMVTKRLIATEDLFISMYYADWQNYPTRTLNYYLEKLLHENSGVVSHDNRKYIRSDQYSESLNISNINSVNAKEIYGFEAGQIANKTTDSADFFYARKTGDLTYNLQGGSFPAGALPDAGGYGKTTNGYQSVKFEERLSNFKPQKIPTRSENSIEYTFLGWFYDIGGLEEVDFAGDTMPSGPLEIFARWSSTDHTATFYDGTRGPQKKAEAPVINGYVQMPNVYTVGDHVDGKGVFQGWQWYTGSVLSDFAEDTVVREDINLYAKWKTDGFTVTYVMGGGTGNEPVDDNTYRLGESATVLPWTGNAPAGQFFVGWMQQGDNTAYFPDSTVTVAGDMTFTAQYATTYKTVIFGANGGKEADRILTVGASDYVTALGANAFTRDGHTLVNWTTDANGGGLSYQPGASVPVMVDVMLYAQWDADGYVVTFKPGSHGSLTGEVRHTAPYGTVLSTLTPPTPVPDDGYYFHGWDIDLDSASVTSSMVVTADFRAKTPITIAAKPNEKVYDGTSLTSPGYEITPALTGVTESGITTAGSITDVGEMTVTPNIDNLTLISGGETVTDRYSVTTAGATLKVTPAELTVTPRDEAITVGDPAPAFTAEINGFVGSENETDLNTLPQFTTGYVPGSSPSGTYDIIPEGAAARNYTFQYITGTLTVGQAQLTVTAQDMTITTGNPVPDFAADYVGFVNGEDETDLDTLPQFSTNYTHGSPAGTYDIIPEGAADQNYRFQYVNGTLTVKAKPPSGGGSSGSARSSSDRGRGSYAAAPAKTQIPSSAFTWDGRTLTIDYDGITPLGLQRVLWDGNEIEAYHVYRGSVLIRFDQDFISSQPVGQHTVRVEFLNHTAETTVMVGAEGSGVVITETGEAGASPSYNGNHNPSTGK